MREAEVSFVIWMGWLVDPTLGWGPVARGIGTCGPTAWFLGKVESVTKGQWVNLWRQFDNASVKSQRDRVLRASWLVGRWWRGEGRAVGGSLCPTACGWEAQVTWPAARRRLNRGGTGAVHRTEPSACGISSYPKADSVRAEVTCRAPCRTPENCLLVWGDPPPGVGNWVQEPNLASYLQSD